MGQYKKYELNAFSKNSSVQTYYFKYIPKTVNDASKLQCQKFHNGRTDI